MRSRSLAVGFSLSLFVARAAFAATTINVPGDAATIQAGIDLAQAGDTVLVAAGTYRGSSTIHVNKRITLASLYHTTGLESFIDQTIIDSGASTTLDVTTAGAGALITGFTFKGPDKGIQLMARADVTHCSFKDTGGDSLSWEDGGAGQFAYNRFVNCGDDCIDSDDDSNSVANGDRIIEHNTMNGAGDDCIEIRLQGYTGTEMKYYLRYNTIENCTDDGVQLIDYSGLSSRRFYIYRNLFRTSGTGGVGATANGSTDQSGAGSPLVEPVQIYNNTIIGPKWGIVGGTNMLVVNNIIKGTTLYALRMLQDKSWAAYNDLHQNAANADATSQPLVGEGMLYTDPLLDSASQLAAGSPCIDAGVAHYEKNGQVLDVTDHLGSAPDMGAYENGSGLPPINRAPSVNAGTDNQTYHPTNTVVLDGTVTDDGKPTGVLDITWSMTEGPGTVTFANLKAADTSATLSKQGTYKLKLEASDGELTSSDSVMVKYVQAGSGAKIDIAAPGTTYFEAEAFSWLYAPATAVDDAAASGARTLLAPEGGGTEARSEYTLTLRQEGYSYYVWVRMAGPDAAGDSVAVSFNNGAERVIPTTADLSYHWEKMAGSFPSPAGEYPFVVRAAEDGVRWDRIVFTTDASFVPDDTASIPPAAPSNLAANAASSSRINLTWQDNADIESGFRIERCQGSGCTSFAQVATAPADATGHADTSLTASTTYRYRVVAYNAFGASSYSNVASATTNAPPPPGSVLFQDDFEDGVEDGWSEHNGSWSVVSSGSKVYQQSSTTGDGIASAGDPVWGDYTVEARIKPVSFNAAGGFVRLIGRFRDVSNYYYLLLRSTQVLELKKLAGGTATTLGSKAFTVSPGSWYTLKLELVGTSLKAYVNGQLELSATDSLLTGGSIAVGTFNASGEVDDVVVRVPGSAPDTTPPAAPTGLRVISP